MRNIIFLFFVCFVSSVSNAKNKTIEQHWKEVGWTYSTTLKGVLQEKNCYASEKDFLSCMFAFNSMINHAEEDWVLVPTERLKNEEKNFGDVEKNFGPLSLVNRKKSLLTSPADIYEFNKRQRVLANQAWKKLFTEQKNSPVPFNEVTEWLTAQEFFKENESYTVSSGVNAILEIVNDPHTRFEPTAALKEEEKEESFVGIGITLRSIAKGDKSVLSITPLEGSPALAAGIWNGDILLEVDGKNVEALSVNQVVTRMIGEKGTPVEITLLRKGEKIKIRVVRSEIRMANTSGRLLEDSENSVGYVKLRSFMVPTGCTDVKKKIEELEKKGSKGLIFDLRENPGGLLGQAVCLGNLFLERLKTIVLIKSLIPGVADNEFKTAREAVTKLPLITLLDEGSASASELLAGALQDHGRSIILGVRSFGKGTVQDVLKNQTFVSGKVEQGKKRGKVTFIKTTARFHMPSGRTNQLVGIIPDIEVPPVPNPTKDDLVALREEDEYTAIPAVGNPWKQPRPETINKLKKCMADSGQSLTLYKKGLGKPLAPDYQLLSAIDAVNCEINKKMMPMEEVPKVSYFFPEEKIRSAVEDSLKETLKDYL